MTTNLSETYTENLKRHVCAALVETIKARPKMTVEELRGLLSDAPGAASLTLGEALAVGDSIPAKRRSSGGKLVAGDQQKSRNVRTEEGRQAFDEEVLGALQECGGEDVSATDIRNHISADPHQLRASLNRMIAEGTVTFTGKARGTRYSIAG